MDRPIIYSTEQGRSTDFLFGQRAAMVGLAKLTEALFGTSTLASGLSCLPTTPAGLTVNVLPGQIYSLTSVDATAYGVLSADTTDQIVKQGLLMATQNLSCPAPTTTGYSVNYLIQATYQDQDLNNVVLPYYNSANPSQPLSGQNNSGAAQPTERHGVCVVSVKTGAAATTGSQTTPAPDAGYVGLWVVTVANGQTQITSSSIAPYTGAPILPAGCTLANAVQMIATSGTLGAPVSHQTTLLNSGSNITLSLPAASSVPQGRRMGFLNINAGVGTIQRAGADTITVSSSTVNSQALGNGDTLVLESNGSNGWYAVSGSVQLAYAAMFAGSYGSSGSQQFPSGGLFQFGTGTTTSGSGTITFPRPFPNACRALLLTENAASGWTTSNLSLYGVASRTTTGATVKSVNWNGTTFITGTSGNFDWFAVGN